MNRTKTAPADQHQSRELIEEADS
ncbi:hypothetical protein CAEBREN_30169 [Caenorhabditis brenneri]|uniref:Uncharacterized protein n=1 Tax=Caenorhabditis brenneri TaxID=135651 RepID=G0NVK8_CAEBE|nr:hypothetical protein CAEBREN_30169 [Caenorhabditis brenneri]